jgi:hypothetical protein
MAETGMVEKVARALAEVLVRCENELFKLFDKRSVKTEEQIMADVDRTWSQYEKDARAAIEAMRPTNKQVLAAVDEWLSEPEGFSLRSERLPDTVELEWLRSAALIGAGAVFPAALNEEVAG